MNLRPTLSRLLPLLASGALAACATNVPIPEAPGASTPPALVRYVACPVYRDTDAGRKSGCWLATDPATGVRHDLSDSPSKPLIGRLVLVEGVPTTQRDVCGGLLLQPVRVSVLDRACAAVLIPAEGHPSKPSVTPRDILQPLSVPRPALQPPFQRSEFHILFDHGDDRLLYQSAELPLERASLLALASNAREVLVTGHADTEGVDASGERLRESLSLARARAEMAAEALRRLGVGADRLRVQWQGTPAPLHGAGAMAEPSRRRVTVTVTP